MQKYFYMSAILFALFFSGCGDGGSSSTTPEAVVNTPPTAVELKSGNLVDANISGIDYTCGGTSGVTTSSGQYSCPTGSSIDFYVGSLHIGAIAAMAGDGITYPQDLLNISRSNFTDSNVVKLAQFIQSLDDGSVAGVITLSQATKAKFTTTQTLADMSETDVSTLLNSFGITYIDATTAINHLRNNMPTYAAEADAAAALLAQQAADAAAALAAQQVPPVMGNIPNQTLTSSVAMTTLNISTYVTLTNADAITAYTLTGRLPTGLNFNTTTGTLSGTPTQTGTFNLSVTATDNDGVSNSDSFSITVAAQQVPPVMGNIPNQTLTSSVAMTTLNISTYVTLTNADAITAYTLTGRLPTGLNFNTTTGTLSGTPTQRGVFNLSITATDNDGASNSDSFSITVEAAVTVFVKKTGQTASYDTAGNLVADNSLKDDGYYQKGETPRYTRASDMVSDALTGLMWQDDAAAASTTKQWLTNDNYNTCANDTSSPACNDTTGDTAVTYCSDLSLGGYTDWRLPTSTELEGILDYGKVSPAIDTVYFNNVSSSYYWSSTTYEGYKGGAWNVYFDYGYVDGNYKDLNRYVRCVRAGQ